MMRRRIFRIPPFSRDELLIFILYFDSPFFCFQQVDFKVERLQTISSFCFCQFWCRANFNFLAKNNDNPLFFGEKIAKATRSLVDKIQGFAKKVFVFYQEMPIQLFCEKKKLAKRSVRWLPEIFLFFGKKEMLIHSFWKKHCQNHKFVDRQNPKFYQKYFRFLAKNFQSILFLAKNC